MICYDKGMDTLVSQGMERWVDLLQSTGIIWSIVYSAWSGRRDLVSRWVENRFLATRHHRELWQELSDHPELRRVEKRNVDLARDPIQLEEERFVNMVILHLNASYFAMRNGFLPVPEGLDADICSFLALPIPREVWERTRDLRDRRFVEFVEGALARDRRE